MRPHHDAFHSLRNRNFEYEQGAIDLRKATHTMLLSYAWHNDYCFPGQQRLAADIGTSWQSVKIQIKELERKGFIKIKRLGQGRPDLHEINLKAKAISKKR